MSKPTSQRLALPLGIQSRLVALNVGAIQLEAATTGTERTLPDRLLAMPWGITDTNKGRLIVNSTTVGVLPHNQAKGKYDRVAFDFNHNTVDPAPADEPLKVAGWGTPEVVPGEGIYLSAIEYTEEGRASLLGGHYPDLSPTLHVNAAGEVIFMHSLAAVRQGEVDGLTLFTPTAGSKADTALKALSAEGMFALSADDYQKPDGEPDWRAITIAALNATGASLDDDAESTDILAAVSALRSAETKPETPESPSNLTTQKSMSADTVTTPAAPDHAALESRLVALEARGIDTERQLILSAAKAAGKVIPLSVESIAKTDPAILKEIVDGLPAGQVPLASETEGAEEISLSAGGVTAADIAVAKQLGIDPASMKGL